MDGQHHQWRDVTEHDHAVLARLRMLLGQCSERLHLKKGALTADFSGTHEVRVYGLGMPREALTFVAGALAGAGMTHHEQGLGALPRRELDGSIAFHSMNDAMLCAYALATPAHERARNHADKVKADRALAAGSGAGPVNGRGDR
jgi:hypothetical protein